MADHSQRDRSVERLLKETLPGALAAPSPACVDAETLAAWADGAMSSDEAARVESHLSGCARCQAMAAVFGRTEPADVAAGAPFWRQWPVRWLVPLSIGATAVLVWSVIPRNTEKLPATPTMARVESAPVPEPTEQAPTAAVESAASAPVDKKTADRLERRTANETFRSPADAPKGDLRQQVSDASDLAKTKAAAERESAEPNVSSRTAAAMPSVSSAMALEIVEIVSENRSDDTGRASAAGRGGRASGAATLAVPSAPPPAPARWRIVDRTVVERSTDVGRTWTSTTLPAGVVVAAGASPSWSVCWLVGPNGVVLRSTDGRTFVRVPFPDEADLTSVTAQDANRVTVTARDGRTFTTTDGSTWR